MNCWPFCQSPFFFVQPFSLCSHMPFCSKLSKNVKQNRIENMDEVWQNQACASYMNCWRSLVKSDGQRLLVRQSAMLRFVVTCDKENNLPESHSRILRYDRSKCFILPSDAGFFEKSIVPWLSHFISGTWSGGVGMSIPIKSVTRLRI